MSSNQRHSFLSLSTIVARHASRTGHGLQFNTIFSQNLIISFRYWVLLSGTSHTTLTIKCAPRHAGTLSINRLDLEPYYSIGML